MLDTKVFYDKINLSRKAGEHSGLHWYLEQLPIMAMETGPVPLCQVASLIGIEDDVKTKYNTEIGVKTQDLAVLKMLVDFNMLAQSTAELLHIAAANADDPANLLSFGIALRHFCDENVPIRETLRMLIVQGLEFKLQWSAEQWWQAYARASFLYSGKDSKKPQSRAFPPMPSPPKNDSVTLIETPNRLSREAYRQRSSKILSFADNIASGKRLCASVLLEGKRWTVLYKPEQVGKRDCVSSYTGADHDTPQKSVRRKIRNLLV